LSFGNRVGHEFIRSGGDGKGEFRIVFDPWPDTPFFVSGRPIGNVKTMTLGAASSQVPFAKVRGPVTTWKRFQQLWNRGFFTSNLSGALPSRTKLSLPIQIGNVSAADNVRER